MSETTPALTITARPEKGFRRAGVHHPARAVTHPPGTFTAEQVEALKAEPHLVVVETAPAPMPPPPKEKPPAK
ncbi:HI1506-related protein [uncultured Rhodospira sp.]|uniref:HI1506-related protein n=1 Tax=uncultured Rhodospira sp. TaxID=1936189 RepID=UPI00262F9629|nr:HI1506-related protein [uncultured Rhodospira sp.]